ncbi:MAG: hypothetical protein PF692_11230 [Kiritimatiellae bacterium]|jgi:thiol-disulfide isomerase/thioredoxin|nr:hypothetical protein [Kiritimatiellia bacterium]
MISMIKSSYDKIILILVVIALLATAAYLYINVGQGVKDMAEVENEIVSYTKANPNASVLDVSQYEDTIAEITNPYQLNLADPGWTNVAMFVPESRVVCIDCKIPIAYFAKKCPFCQTVQPPLRSLDEKYDGDKDGIPDMYEKEHGLNHRLDDSMADADGDGFSNIVEFKSNTSLSDPNSYPPPDTELKVVSVVADPFNLLFKGSSLLPDKSRMFQINLKNGDRTHFKKLGEKVEGFTLSNFGKGAAKAQNEGERDKDVLRLISPSGKKIDLIEGKGTAYKEYTVTLKFNITGEEFKLRAGDTFKLKNKPYQFIHVDNSGQNIVIKRIDDDEVLVFEGK